MTHEDVLHEPLDVLLAYARAHSLIDGFQMMSGYVVVAIDGMRVRMRPYQALLYLQGRVDAHLPAQRRR